jgi:hypothetical protein
MTHDDVCADFMYNRGNTSLVRIYIKNSKKTLSNNQEVVRMFSHVLYANLTHN